MMNDDEKHMHKTICNSKKVTEDLKKLAVEIKKLHKKGLINTDFYIAFLLFQEAYLVKKSIMFAQLYQGLSIIHPN